ncbi:MAG: hypothetical protein ACXABY_16120 [Candidatus Thorarchaeota archaeon]
MENRIAALESNNTTGPQVYDATGQQVGQLLDGHTVLIQGFALSVTYEGFVSNNLELYFTSGNCSGQEYINQNFLTPVNLTPRVAIDMTNIVWEYDNSSTLSNSEINSYISNEECLPFVDFPVRYTFFAVNPALDLSTFVPPFELR